MNNALVSAMERGRIVSLTQFIAITGVATIVPLFHQQAITGPIAPPPAWLAIG